MKTRESLEIPRDVWWLSANVHGDCCFAFERDWNPGKSADDEQPEASVEPLAGLDRVALFL